MSTHKFCGGKCPQCPPGSATYVSSYVYNVHFKRWISNLVQQIQNTQHRSALLSVVSVWLSSTFNLCTFSVLCRFLH